MIRWTLIAIVALLALVLGFWGFMEEFATLEGASRPVVILNNFWRTVALFFFATDPTWGETNVKLVAARLLAPAATVGTIVEVALNFFEEKITVFRARRSRGHTIIVGCGERGQHFLRDSQSRVNNKPVVIDRSSDPAVARRARDAGALFIPGDARDATVLENAGLSHAKHFVILGNEDTDNLEVLAAAQSIQINSADTLNVLFRFDDSNLVRELDRDDGFVRRAGCNVTAFNLAAATARRFFELYPLVDEAELRAQGRVHLVCVGWTPFVFEILEQLSRLSPFRNFPSPQVDLFVADEVAVRSELDSIEPAIQAILDIKFNHLDGASKTPTPLQIEYVEPGPQATVTAVLVSIGQDAKTAAAALAIRERSQQSSRWRAPVFAHLNVRSSLSSLFEERSRVVDPGQTIVAVGFQEDVCRIDVLDSKREELARRLHDSYLAFNGVPDLKYASPSSESEQPWGLLKQTYRLASRRAADHLPLKILSIGAVGVRSSFIASDHLRFGVSNDELEALAELEHKSWEMDRRLDGWCYGTHRDNQARKHPALTPYEQLSEGMKDFDRDQIRAIARHLLCDGDESTVKRECRLGILGHNKVTRDDKVRMLRELEHSVLPQFMDKHRHDFISVCTPLAPGTDTILTEALLERLRKEGIDHRLIVIRTLPLDNVVDEFQLNYRDGFAWRMTEQAPVPGDRSREGERMSTYLSAFPLSVPRAYIADLIPPGLAIDYFAVSQEQRTRAFRRAAAWLVERCDVLVAYHDPNRAAGQGGTRETLDWARCKTSIPPDVSTLNSGEDAKSPQVIVIEP